LPGAALGTTATLPTDGGSMPDPWLQQLEAWRNFYMLLGTAAATLTGLMFVVVSLGPQQIGARTATGVRAFVTPTVVYFTTVLVVVSDCVKLSTWDD
jgi:CBS domain containing-hemolysin-like protein